MRKIHSIPAAIAAAVVVLAAAGAQADGDAEKGEKVFNRCKACHSLEAGQHRVGPSLAGLWGRKAGSADGFNRYSDGLKNADFSWDEEKLEEYLADPKKMFSDSKMMFKVSKEDDREDVVAYLKQATQ